MNLTNSDLSAIRKVVKEEIQPLQKDVTLVKEKVNILESTVNKLNKRVQKIDKNLNYSINFMDKEYLRLKKYTAKVANEIDFAPPDF